MKNLIDNFRNPTNRFGPSPFWFLNGDLTKEELEWQIKEMKDKGLSGYVMHSRYGRRIDYFSEDFFDRIGHIIKKSEELGMNAIVYDEDDWPSGMSGTRVIDDHPEYKHKQLEIVYLDCEGQNKIDYSIDKGTIYAAFACNFKVKSDKREECIVSDYVDVMDNTSANGIHLNNNGGYQNIVLFVFQEVSGYTIHTTFPINKGFRAQPNEWSCYFPYGEYVDLLNPDAVDYFIKTTCEEYKKRYKDHFGKTINYFYTDEPGFYTIMRGNDTAIPWSNVFESSFVEKNGYNIKNSILALAYDIGNKTQRIRFDYWNHLTYMFEINFVKKYSDWCNENGLKLTGHYRLCYPQLVWQRNYAGNAMNLFRHMDAPGVDRLDTPGMNDTFATKDWSWQIEDKMCSSIGHQYGIERRMTESFALGGWEYRYADMKRVIDWQYMMGMNLVVPHAFHYSISGQRKKECPPSFFYQNPIWEKYGMFSKYLCRLGEMMIGGKNIADIAVLFPMTTIWADDIPQKEVQDVINNVDRDFSYITDTLLRKNLDYDILGEEEFEKAQMKNAYMVIGDAEYKLLIIPPCITISKESESRIRDFVNCGGKVLFLSRPPQKDIDGNSLKYINELFSGLRDLNTAYDNYNNIHRVCAQKQELSENVVYLNGGVLKDNMPTELLVDAVESLIQRDVKIRFNVGESGNVYYNHHIKDGDDIFFIHNSDEEKQYDIDVTFRCVRKNVYLFDPESGEICLVNPVIENNKSTLHIALKKLKSIFVVFTDDIIENSKIYDSKEDLSKSIDSILLKTEWNNKLRSPNCLVLDTWKMIQNEPTEDTSLISWDSGWGSIIKYKSDFYVEKETGPLTLVMDRIPEIIYGDAKQPINIYVNGNEMCDFKRSDYLDHDMYMADISNLCKVGLNTITIHYNHSMYAFEGKTGIKPVSMMWDCAYIIGDFELKEDAKAMNRYIIVPMTTTIRTGSWTSQGYPYFNGCMQYEQCINVNKDNRARYILNMEDVRDCADVYVNDTFAGSRIWMPYELDISSFLVSGANNIKIQVRNTPKNIMQKCNWVCGIVGEVKINIK